MKPSIQVDIWLLRPFPLPLHNEQIWLIPSVDFKNSFLLGSIYSTNKVLLPPTRKFLFRPTIVSSPSLLIESDPIVDSLQVVCLDQLSSSVHTCFEVVFPLTSFTIVYFFIHIFPTCKFTPTNSNLKKEIYLKVRFYGNELKVVSFEDTGNTLNE